MIAQKDKLLPSQPYFSKLYSDSENISDGIAAVADLFSKDFSHDSLNLIAPTTVPLSEMSTPALQVAFMCFLIRMKKAKRVLEIGTFVGATTLLLARAVGLDGKVTTIEFGKEFYELALRNFDNNPEGRLVTALNGDACDLVETLPKNHFDLIFIDGSKENYQRLLISSETLISQDGIIVIDDIFFHGDALNKQPNTEKGKGCRKVLDYCISVRSLTATLLPVFNGILLLERA